MNLLVLTYHYFHRDGPKDIKREDYSFSVSLENFAGHCAELTSPDFRLMDPARLNDASQYHGEPDRQILITIDDGHQSVGEAAEIIVGRKIAPVLNVIAGLVGRESYLDWSALRMLATQGFSIQSHSMSHHDLTRLEPMDLRAELEQSKKLIEDNIGLPVTMLAAPMGRLNVRVIETALELGYTLIMSSFTGINRLSDDFTCLRRFQVKGDPRTLAIGRYFNPVSGVRIMGAAKNAAKKVMNRFR